MSECRPAAWRPRPGHEPATVTRQAIRALARRWLDLTDEINTHNAALDEMIAAVASKLLARRLHPIIVNDLAASM